MRVSCAPLPARARVGPACSALPPPAEGNSRSYDPPQKFVEMVKYTWVGWVGKKFGWLVLDSDRVRSVSSRLVVVVVVVSV